MKVLSTIHVTNDNFNSNLNGPANILAVSNL